MTGVETPLLWLVLAFTDGPDCLLQGTFQTVEGQQTFIREDGCAIRSLQEGRHVVFWSADRWVAIRIPSGTTSLAYRWGRASAHVNGNSVPVHYGNLLGALRNRPTLSDRDRPDDANQKWRISTAPAPR